MTLDYAEFAEIIQTRHENPLGGEPSFSYEWVGSPHAPVRVPAYYAHHLGGLNFPFKLEAVYRDCITGWAIYRRTDVPINLRLIQFLESRWLKHCKAFNGFQMRLIMTLHVWGLAYVPDYEMPSWNRVGRKR